MESIYLAILYYWLLVAVPCEGGYTWYTPNRINAKCAHIKRELVMDGAAKTKAIQFVKRSYSKNYQFTLGEQYFAVKNRYYRMMDLYMGMEKEWAIKFQEWRTKALCEIMRIAMEANQMTQMTSEGDASLMKRKEAHLFQMQQYNDFNNHRRLMGQNILSQINNTILSGSKRSGGGRRAGGKAARAIVAERREQIRAMSKKHRRPRRNQTVVPIQKQ